MSFKWRFCLKRCLDLFNILVEMLVSAQEEGSQLMFSAFFSFCCSSSLSCYCTWQRLHLSRKWISLPQLSESRSARITSMMYLLWSSRQVKWETGYGSNVIWQLFSSFKLKGDAKVWGVMVEPFQLRWKYWEREN